MDADAQDISAEPAHEALNQTWRKISKLFSGARFGISPPQDWLPLLRRLYGDTITSSHELRHWRKLKAITDPLSDPEVDYLRALAQQRFEFAAAAFRMNAVLSVTVPASLAVLLNQFAPGSVQEIWREEETLLTIAALILLFNLTYIFGNVFKARELRMALEIEAAERRLERGDTVATLGGDTSEMSF